VSAEPGAGLGGDRPAEEQGAGWQAPVAAIASVPRALGTALEDIRTIARGMQVLPQLARTLAEIERRTDSLDREVQLMRQAVESMGSDVQRLDPRLEQVQDSLRPLRRIGSRLRRGQGDDDE
jgi:hypothetical protein